MKVQTFDNGDITLEGYTRITPEGCPAQVFKHPTADIFITVQCQCLVPGEPYQATILNCPQYGDLRTKTGTIEYDEPMDDGLYYQGLDAWLTLHLGH